MKHSLSEFIVVNVKCKRSLSFIVGSQVPRPHF
jgi:hypothetical protein